MYMMAEKNSIEKGGMRLSHIRDSAAMCNILAKLNEQVNKTYIHLITIYYFGE